jgi:hypothetical protein
VGSSARACWGEKRKRRAGRADRNTENARKPCIIPSPARNWIVVGTPRVSTLGNANNGPTTGRSPVRRNGPKLGRNDYYSPYEYVLDGSIVAKRWRAGPGRIFSVQGRQQRFSASPRSPALPASQLQKQVEDAFRNPRHRDTLRDGS